MWITSAVCVCVCVCVLSVTFIHHASLPLFCAARWYVGISVRHRSISFLNQWLLLPVFIGCVPWARKTDVERDKTHLGAQVVKCIANVQAISSKPS